MLKQKVKTGNFWEKEKEESGKKVIRDGNA